MDSSGIQTRFSSNFFFRERMNKCNEMSLSD